MAPTIGHLPGDAWVLKISLRNIAPEIWRRVVVSPSMTLFELHRLIQQLGWEDRHLWAFRDAETGACIGELPSRSHPLPPPPGDRPAPDARQVALMDCVECLDASFLYEYDFGDGWLHEINLEGILEFPDPFGTWVHGGANSFPPEDCGGRPGYGRLQAYWRDGRDMHGDDDYEEWASGIEKTTFDLAATQASLPPLSQSNRDVLDKAVVTVVKAIGKRAPVLDLEHIHDLQSRIRKTVNEFDRDHGFATSVGSITYTHQHGHMTLETATIREDGIVMDREASAYLQRAHEHGLSPDWLGKPFACGKDLVRITGLKPRSKQSVILASIPEPGKPMQKFKMHPTQVAAHFKDR